MQHITSADNKIIKHARKLASKSYRDKTGEFFVEGRRIVLEALTYCKSKVLHVLMTENFAAENLDIKKMLDDFAVNVYTLPEKLFTVISDTQTPQGIAAVMKKPENSADSLDGTASLLILDSVAEPGNMGTIIRTAGVFGFNHIIVTKGCVDIFSPKVVRSTMGAVFKTEFIFIEGKPEIEELKEKGFSVVSSTPCGGEDIGKAMFDGKFALVIGNEANGISQEILDISDKRVKIPMNENSESLNAAVAAGILMYQLAVNNG